MKPKRSTLREIARSVGLSVATVCRALHRDPRISMATRRKVESKAKELRYCPDPLLSSLAIQLSNRRTKSTGNVLAYLVDTSPENLWPLNAFKQIHAGAFMEAERQGFKLETFSMEGLSEKRLTQILLTRDIRGLMIAPFFLRDEVQLNLQWHHFSSIAIGHTLKHPALHRVVNDSDYAIQTIMSELQHQGLRSAGLVLQERHNHRNGYEWVCQFLLKYRNRFPIERNLLLLPETRYTPEELQNRLKRIPNLPECLIFMDHLNLLSLKHQDQSGTKPAPKIILLNKLHQQDRIPGFCVDFEALGKTALQYLLTMLRTNERGIPHHPSTIYIKGFWSP